MKKMKKNKNKMTQYDNVCVCVWKNRNCNTFAEELVNELTQKKLPKWIHRLAWWGNCCSCCLPHEIRYPLANLDPSHFSSNRIEQGIPNLIDKSLKQTKQILIFCLFFLAVRYAISQNNSKNFNNGSVFVVFFKTKPANLIVITIKWKKILKKMKKKRRWWIRFRERQKCKCRHRIISKAKKSDKYKKKQKNKTKTINERT